MVPESRQHAYLEDDPKDPSRRLIRQVLGAVSEYERSMIALRLRSGRELKAVRGGYAFGAPPLGFKSENRALVRDNTEWRTVERVRHLHQQGRSFRQIAETLTAEGCAPKRGDRWHPETLRRIVARPERI